MWKPRQKKGTKDKWEVWSAKEKSALCVTFGSEHEAKVVAAEINRGDELQRKLREVTYSIENRIDKLNTEIELATAARCYIQVSYLLAERRALESLLDEVKPLPED